MCGSEVVGCVDGRGGASKEQDQPQLLFSSPHPTPPAPSDQRQQTPTMPPHLAASRPHTTLAETLRMTSMGVAAAQAVASRPPCTVDGWVQMAAATRPSAPWPRQRGWRPRRQHESACPPPMLPPVSVRMGWRREGRRRAGDGWRRAASLRTCPLHEQRTCAAKERAWSDESIPEDPLRHRRVQRAGRRRMGRSSGASRAHSRLPVVVELSMKTILHDESNLSKSYDESPLNHSRMPHSCTAHYRAAVSWTSPRPANVQAGGAARTS